MLSVSELFGVKRQAVSGILKSWSDQAFEILLYQSSWEYSFLRVLQEWMWSQSPGFTFGPSISWKEPVPWAGRALCSPGSSVGPSYTAVLPNVTSSPWCFLSPSLTLIGGSGSA